MLGKGLPGRHKRHYPHFQPVRAWGTEPGGQSLGLVVRTPGFLCELLAPSNSRVWRGF